MSSVVGLRFPFRGFVAPVPNVSNSPTGEDVMKGSYKSLDARAVLKNQNVLYFTYDGSNKLKVMLLCDNQETHSYGTKLSAVAIETVKMAIENGVLSLDGKTFEFDNTRALEGMLKNIENKQINKT